MVILDILQGDFLGKLEKKTLEELSHAQYVIQMNSSKTCLNVFTVAPKRTRPTTNCLRVKREGIYTFIYLTSYERKLRQAKTCSEVFYYNRYSRIRLI